MTIEAIHVMFGLFETNRREEFVPGTKVVLDGSNIPERIRTLEVLTKDAVRYCELVKGFSDPIQVRFHNKEEINSARFTSSGTRIRWKP